MRTEDANLANRYIDGELEGEEKAAFERLLIERADLKAYVEEVEALTTAAGAMGVFKAPDVRLTLRRRAPAGSRSSRMLPFLAGAAVAAACVLVGIGVGMKVLNPATGRMTTEVLRIVYYAPDASTVSVLGDFNGWSREIPLSPRGDGGYWLKELHVKPGEYRYVLMVDGKELPGDPLADYVIDDDFGSKNSVVRVGL